MRRRRTRLFAAAGLLALAAGGIQATGAAMTDETETTLRLETGTVEIERTGDALVLDGSRMVPGDRAEATVRVGNSGTEPARFTLSSETLDSTKPNGCALRDALRLRVVELGAAGERDEASDGPLGEGDVALGAMRPGTSRRYELSVRFVPRGGDTDPAQSDNCVQGSELRERFTWEAVEVAR